MPYQHDRFYDGQSWNRAEVVVAQRARAVATAQELGWAVAHRNLLTDPLEPAVVENFEQTFQVRLPAEYRSFLLEVGDGGDGPGLYMRPLGAPFDDSLPWEEGEIHRDPAEPNELLGKPFPHAETLQIEPQAMTPQMAAGALFLFDHGCALWDLLIVTGDSAGQIWLDRLADSEGLRPATSDSGQRIGFAEHYCRWLDGHS